MASKGRKEDDDRNKDASFVRRLVYDVMVYTLPKCGFTEMELPSTDSEENVYNRANFVEIAGLSALRISLVMRDKWKRMFVSRRTSSGFNKENIPSFLENVVLCCPLSWTDTRQSVIEAFLALGNEIIMFFHHEGIRIDLNIILNSISIYIIGVVSSEQNISKTIEELFGKFDNISGYTRWITDFIANFAIPYGSKDLSNHFFEYVRKKWKDDLQMTSLPETRSTTKLRDYLGFLPDDLFAIIAYEESTELLTNLPSILESILESDYEPSEPQKLPSSSESGAVGGKESQKRQLPRSANASIETAQGENNKLGIENDLEQMSLGAAKASQESGGAIPKRKKSQKKNR